MNTWYKIFTVLIIISLNKVTLAQSGSFKHYRVALYKGHPAKPLIKGNPLAEMYRTVINDTYYNTPHQKKWHGQGGLNFAGHYCFVYWGCGSNCQHGAIVDLKTGKIYDGPTASEKYVYKPWSRLLIVNDPKVADDCSFCKPEYWMLNEAKKTFVKVK